MAPPNGNRTLPPPSWLPRGASGLRIDVKQAMIPISLALLALLAFGFRAPTYVVVICALVLPVTLIGGMFYVIKALPGFELQFTRTLQTGNTQALKDHLAKAPLLRFFAPAYRMQSKRGLILLMDGRYREANEALEDAYLRAPPGRRASLLGPIAQVKYHLEEYDQLLEIAEQWRARALYPGAANVYLAAAHIHDIHPDPGLARELLDEVEGSLSPSEAKVAEKLRATLN